MNLVSPIDYMSPERIFNLHPFLVVWNPLSHRLVKSESGAGGENHIGRSVISAYIPGLHQTHPYIGEGGWKIGGFDERAAVRIHGSTCDGAGGINPLWTATDQNVCSGPGAWGAYLLLALHPATALAVLLLESII